MLMEFDVVVWRIFFSVCRIYKNLVLGEIVIINILFFDGGDYVLFLNIYCFLNKWSSSEKMRKMMIREGVWKDCGKSWIELGGVIYYFKVGERFYFEIEVIDKVLK